MEKEREYFTKLREELQPGDGHEDGVHGADSQYKINCMTKLELGYAYGSKNLGIIFFCGQHT